MNSMRTQQATLQLKNKIVSALGWTNYVMVLQFLNYRHTCEKLKSNHLYQLSNC